ncbi:MAG TPA: Wzt carbohydrate-binding domain-containing protein, partial [Roseiflexaceae bacterium]|nr:Wzt carbohydrate-binding domain-containing protein [Roseiflexaceae bacterium]
TRILEPSSGAVRLSGRVAALLELGSGFHPDLSGRENVFLNGSLMGFGRREMQARLDEIIDFSGIGDFIDMEVKHYSSGMYTRLAFAVATSVDPDILITDEVLAVGDEAFQRKCMDRIFRFRQQGKTIVFVSHGLDTVRTLCDKALWLEKGEARAFGPAGQVVDAYLADVNRREEELLRRQGLDRPVDTDPARRRGTREIEIVRVELLDADGRAMPVGHTGEPLTLRMHYVASRPIARPVFGVGVHHESGFWIAGPNTAFSQFSIPLVEGTGVLDYHIPRLPLLDGRYLLSVAAFDEAMLHPYDMHDRLYPLVVRNQRLTERYGSVALDGSWRLAPEV